MDNASSLFLSDRREPPEPGAAPAPLLHSAYHLPLLWLALFEPADIEAAGADDRDGAVRLVRPRADAVARLQARAPAITAAFAGCHPTWIAQFQQALESMPLRYVHVDTSGVGRTMGDAASCRSELAAMLGIFDEPRAAEPRGLLKRLMTPVQPLQGAWAVFEPRFGSAYRGEQGEQPWPYCGTGAGNRAMAWEAREEPS